MKTLAYRSDDPQIRSIFENWSKKQREIFLVKNVGFINLHIRSDPPGFWGVRKNILKDFEVLKNELGIKCFFTLLVRIQNSEAIGGYILEDMTSTQIIKKPSEQKDDYKINENILDVNYKFLNLGSICDELLSKNIKKKVIRRQKR